MKNVLVVLLFGAMLCVASTAMGQNIVTNGNPFLDSGIPTPATAGAALGDGGDTPPVGPRAPVTTPRAGATRVAATPAQAPLTYRPCTRRFPPCLVQRMS
jgi:hypothetical protein